MSDRLEIAPGLPLDPAEVELRASRSSGPGGQHANVTASRIEARFVVADSSALDEDQKRLLTARLGPVVTAVSQESRSQHRNRELALERLAARLRSGLKRRRPRRPTAPSKGAKRRRLEAKRRASERKASRRKPRPGEWD